VRSRRVLCLVPEGGTPPDNLEGYSMEEIAVWKMEYDVTTALFNQGHKSSCLEVKGDLDAIKKEIEERRPHVVFNMLEEFHGIVAYDANVVSFLELLKVPYTGCNPRGLILARDKALTKKILSYHRIGVPGFAVYPRGRRVRAPRRLQYPLLVKSLTEEASTGISQASVVYDDAELRKRVEFMHEQVGTDAIAEEYIEGREINLGIIGNQRLFTFPIWELVLERLPEGAPRIATARVKWDLKYQDKYGITTRAATDLPDALAQRIRRIGTRSYRLLGLSGYARVDFRLKENGEVYVLEANPNPDLSHDEDFSLAAEEGGLPYPRLIERILSLGLSYHAAWYET